MIKNIKSSRIVSEYTFRTKIFTVISFITNLSFAIFNGVLGILNHSLWFVSMSAYYIILSAMRISAIITKSNRKILMLCGIMLTASSLLLSVISYVSLSQDVATKHGTIPMITIATYTFCKIAMCIIAAVKQKNHSVKIKTINTIRYAEVAVSVFTMQQSMLVSFDGMQKQNALIMNAMTGGIVCLFIMILGVYLIKKGIRKNGKIKNSKGK